MKKFHWSYEFICYACARTNYQLKKNFVLEYTEDDGGKRFSLQSWQDMCKHH